MQRCNITGTACVVQALGESTVRVKECTLGGRIEREKTATVALGQNVNRLNSGNDTIF